MKEKKRDCKIDGKNCFSYAKNFLLKVFDTIKDIIMRVNISHIKIGSFDVHISEHGKSIICCVAIVFLLFCLSFGVGATTTFSFFILLITMFFFRDPERVLPNCENVVVSPCDGIVLNIKESLLPEELGDIDGNKYTKISVLMNIADVHVQRIPVDCTIKQIEYIDGAFINASFDKANKSNERNIVLAERENGDRICIVQIAGFIARRIVCMLTKDEKCKIGERYGMIKFGSRIELYIPISYKLGVLVGQRVVGGETIVASF